MAPTSSQLQSTGKKKTSYQFKISCSVECCVIMYTCTSGGKYNRDLVKVPCTPRHCGSLSYYFLTSSVLSDDPTVLHRWLQTIAIWHMKLTSLLKSPDQPDPSLLSSWGKSARSTLYVSCACVKPYKGCPISCWEFPSIVVWEFKYICQLKWLTFRVDSPPPCLLSLAVSVYYVTKCPLQKACEVKW